MIGLRVMGVCLDGLGKMGRGCLGLGFWTAGGMRVLFMADAGVGLWLSLRCEVRHRLTTRGFQG